MNDLEIFVILFLLFLVVIIAIPLMILSKISSLNQQIKELNKKVGTLLATDKTTPPALSIPAEVKIKQVETVTPPPVPASFAVRQEPIGEEWAATADNIPVYSMPPIPEVPAVAFAEDTQSPPIPPKSPVIQPPPIPAKPSVIQSPPPIPKADQRSFIEQLLGDNWLSKIGIVTLVLGVAFFVKYAIDQNWINEIGRVGIGLLTGALIIGVAHQLKAKYHVFSSILAGGGISVFYITVTLAFREYALFDQPLAFVLLIITTIFSVALSLLYDRKELAVFSLLGGFASPLLVSTGTGNYIILFSYILILNVGMLVVSFVKQWRIIGMISYLLSLLFFVGWLFKWYEDEYIGVALFATLFFIQFYLLAMLDHFNAGKTISLYQIFLLLSNNLFTYLAYIYIFKDYTTDLNGLITISLAVVNAIVMVVLFRNSRIDKKLIYLLIGIVMSFVTLAIPVQLKGHVITLFWAAESVVLLWLWQKSRIRVFHIGFILVILFMFCSYWMDFVKMYSLHATVPVLVNRLCVTGISVVAAFAVNMLLLRRDKEQLAVNRPLITLFKLAVICMSYVVTFIELNCQLAYTDTPWFTSFRELSMFTFTIAYIAILGLIYHKQISSRKYMFVLLYGVTILYAFVYSYFVAELRYDIFKMSIYPAGYFSVHVVALLAITYIVYLLIRNIKSMGDLQPPLLSWALTVFAVAILSVETDNLIIWLISSPATYKEVLYDVHTFGYPILWGVIAMLLMIWGLNRKVTLLRKIALVFFGLIIVKFYAYDVWYMSQTGRIISFVMLGVILLLVSFLQQKIRTLVKEDKIIKHEEPECENKE